MNKDIKLRLLDRRRIDPVTGCWLYTGSILSNGYGNIKYKGKTKLVHRLSLEVFKNVIFEADEQSNHTIECPNKHCFNPDHLYKGTQTNNMRDRSKVNPPKSRMQKNAEYYRRHNQHRQSFGR